MKAQGAVLLLVLTVVVAIVLLHFLSRRRPDPPGETRAGSSYGVAAGHDGRPKLSNEAANGPCERSSTIESAQSEPVPLAARQDGSSMEESGDVYPGREAEALERPQPPDGVVTTAKVADPSSSAHTPSVPADEGAILEEAAEEGSAGAEGDDEHEVHPSDDQPAQQKARKKKPRKYRGLDRGARRLPGARHHRRRSGGEEVSTRGRALPLEVRLRFGRGGSCQLSLIACRSRGLPEAITVLAQTGELELQAMQDEWYQDVFPEDLSRILDVGAVWTHDCASEQFIWSLSGRPLYVLADRADISGFVSQACLELGRKHVVLCKVEIESEVEHALKQAGASPTSVLNESSGAPVGWIVFCNVVPDTPVTPRDAADVANALRPLPRIEISLEDGIRIERSNWLEGYPPSIRVYGDPEHAAEVHVDNSIAERGADGCHRAPGWDSLGSHVVQCLGTSKSYSIVPFAGGWDAWDAHVFPVAYGSGRRIAICGPLVRCVSGETPRWSVSVAAPAANPVLVGKTPGQQVIAESASGIRGAPLVASPTFSPVWALPRNPLRCDKKTARIRLVGEMTPPDAAGGAWKGCDGCGDLSIEAWCRVILDANRKGIRTEPDTEDVRALWLQFKVLARSIWRCHK